MDSSSKPYVRWWWFSGEINIQDLDEQIEWLSANGFGGVEIAWVYPLPGTRKSAGTKFLDDEWINMVLHAIKKCQEMSLGCDLTFGTLWPFGGSFVPERNASKTFSGSSKQRISHSWESRYNSNPSLIIDHLDKDALTGYSRHLLDHGFRKFTDQGPLSFFCDSWEVDPDGLSTKGFKESFKERFSYEIDDFLDCLDSDEAVRFDYRRLLADKVLDNFYRPLVEIWKSDNATSRIQCHGAPTDILAAYALVDIPETETLLFDPDFALFAASAAALRQKKLVSSESFTCMYGWVPRPGEPPHRGTELIEDLRCIADAQFAWGVNRVVWHGKPFGTQDKPNYFYAGVHVGSEGTLASSFSPFNSYLEKISHAMQQGVTESRLAVYLPLEDHWMAGEIPLASQKPSSRFFWELQECKIPDHLLPWRPLWLSGAFLSEFTVVNGKMTNGYTNFHCLYIEAEWMTIEHLREIIRLQECGATLCIRRKPKEPGKIGHTEYTELSNRLKIIGELIPGTVLPLMTSEIPLDFWCRRDKKSYYFFISHPGMRKLRYPLKYGYGKDLGPVTVKAVLFAENRQIPVQLDFAAASSLLVMVDASGQTSILT